MSLLHLLGILLICIDTFIIPQLHVFPHSNEKRMTGWLCVRNMSVHLVSFKTEEHKCTCESPHRFYTGHSVNVTLAAWIEWKNINFKKKPDSPCIYISDNTLLTESLTTFPWSLCPKLCWDCVFQINWSECYQKTKTKLSNTERLSNVRQENKTKIDRKVSESINHCHFCSLWVTGKSHTHFQRDNCLESQFTLWPGNHKPMQKPPDRLAFVSFT